MVYLCFAWLMSRVYKVLIPYVLYPYEYVAVPNKPMQYQVVFGQAHPH